MANFFLAKAYLRHLKKAVSKHGIHSPFVFHLVTKVFPQGKDEPEEHPAEDWRTECLLDHSTIHVHDYGTGISGPRKISDIAKHSAKSAEEGRLLHRIIKHLKPKRMLELGTSLGITTIYEASAVKYEKFISLEGCENTAAKAKYALAQNGHDIDVRGGEFESTLEGALHSLGKTDYVFFDGNHREAPTLHYFETCLPFARNDSVFIFDDIHWSAEMESAWEKIKAHEKVKLTIDVFNFGMVFFRSEQLEKEHFVVKF
ncbi:MAG TPA: class I SAM-dependent methyltransferase [Bacteroidia bacterium]|jgi:predicted O-methyltransferase YrrM|nr:class I SAM-dependent methyltransferase [Bacteroidia bacterium]